MSNIRAPHQGSKSGGATPAPACCGYNRKSQVIDSGNTSSLNCSMSCSGFHETAVASAGGCGVADPVRRRWMDIHRKTAAGFGVTESLLLNCNCSGHEHCHYYIEQTSVSAMPLLCASSFLIASDVCRLRPSKNTDSKLPPD